MQCPFCNYDNIEGVDQCERCNAALTDLADLEKKSEIELDLLRRPLGDLIAQDYATVPPDLSVRKVVQRLHDGGHHCAVVLKDDRIVGIFTERDILQKLADQFDARAESPVSDYMTPDPDTLRVGDPVAFGLNRMMVRGYRHIPVLKDGKLAGVVSVRDILGYLVNRFDDLVPADASA